MVRSSKTKQSPRQTEESSQQSGGQSGSAALPTLVGDALPPEALAQVLTAEDIYLSPKVLAAMTGLDEKWFAGAREGLKEVDGPPFIKLGTAKTAPVRYKLADVRKWWAKFPKQVTTHGKLSTFRTAGEFFKEASPASRWLFADLDGEPVDFIVALQSGVFSSTSQPEVAWLTFPEWIARAWNSRRLNRQFAVLLQPLREAALSSFEQLSFETEIRKAAPSEPRRIDDPSSVRQAGSR